MKLCDYGCGRKTKFQLKNGKWCCNYNISSCPKINEKRKRSLKGKSRKSYAVLIRDSDLNPLCEYGCGNEAKYQFKNGKYSCSKSPNACPGIKIKQHTKEANEKIGKKFEGNKNPMFGKKPHLGEKRPEHSKFMKNIWKNPDYISKQIKLRDFKQNKLELFFESWLDENFPNAWKYVGDGQFIISTKCPDFVSINGKKQIIELYGNYWHKDDNPQDRIDLFSKYGYKTLIIWEREIKNLNLVKEKIEKEFHQ